MARVDITAQGNVHEHPCPNTGSSASHRRSKNVLFVIHTPCDAATAVYKNTRIRAEYLERAGHRCTILTPADFPWLEQIGIRLLPLTFPLAVANWLRTKGRHIDVAIFHSYAAWGTSLLLKRFTRDSSLKVAIMFHGLEPLYYARLKREMEANHNGLSWRYRLLHGAAMHRLLRFSSRSADMLFCLNAEEAGYLVDNGWAIRNRPVVLNHAAPESFYISRQYRQRASELLFVGQWLPMKGIHYLVRSFTELLESHPDLHLCCAGTLASEAEVLRSFPPESRGRVTVIPRVTESELIELHRRADIFLLPSLSEGFSLALVEAIASGLPVVTTPIGFAPDALRHQESAIFVPTCDAQALTKAISGLLEDQALRERIGRGAQVVARRFRPNLIEQEFAASFELLASTTDSGDNLSPDQVVASSEA